MIRPLGSSDSRHLRAIGTLLLVWPEMARAHSPIPGIGTFYGSMLHPVIIPSHALILIGLSLALGQQGRPAVRVGLAMLIAAFAAGLTGAISLPLPTPSQRVLLSLSAMLSVAVCIAKPLPLGVISAAALTAGLVLGLDSAPDATGLHEKAVSVAGLFLGVAAVSTMISGLCLTLRKPWQQIGVRVVGSWIVAASVLVLTLLIHAGHQQQALSQTTLKRTEMPC